MRYPSGEEKPEDDPGGLNDLLAELTEKQLAFWQAMEKPGNTQVRAYREAFDAENMSDATVSVKACQLWNSDKFKIIRSALMNAVRERSTRTLEYRIAEMEAFAERCELAGQYGAAFQAKQATGKLEGHYVDKKEITHRQDKEALDALKAIVQDGKPESIAFAMKEAKSLGLQKELETHIKTIH
jgi:hypothetical protein